MGEDVTIPLALNKFNELGFTEVFAKDKVIFVLDHLLPTNNVDSAQTHKKIRKFAKKHEIKYFNNLKFIQVKIIIKIILCQFFQQI